MRILVFANGTPPSRSLVERYQKNVAFIVAADGGANALDALHLAPDFIVGDLDSLGETARKKFPGARLVRRGDQNKTDLEKTLEFCLEKGATEIFVFGATGGRLDHEIANMGILQQFSRKIALALVDDQFLVRVIRGETTFACRPGQLLSLLALQPARGVNLSGVKFPLKNAALYFGGRAVSNVAVEEKVSIRVESGELFLFLAHHVR